MFARGHSDVRAPTPRVGPPAAAAPSTSRTRCPARGFRHEACRPRRRLGVRRLLVRTLHVGVHWAAACADECEADASKTGVAYVDPQFVGSGRGINPNVETASFAPRAGLPVVERNRPRIDNIVIHTVTSLGFYPWRAVRTSIDLHDGAGAGGCAPTRSVRVSRGWRDRRLSRGVS